MKILLITENVTIQKLFKLSAEKRGDDIEIGGKDYIPQGNFDAVFIDNEILENEILKTLKGAFSKAKFVLILNRDDERIEGFEKYLVKPFLPTDLIELLDKLQNGEKNFDLGEFSDNLDLEDLGDMSLDINEEGDFEIGNIEDVFVGDEELNTESLDEDIEDDFEINENELISEDVLEEESLIDEIEKKEEIDEDVALVDLKELQEGFNKTQSGESEIEAEKKIGQEAVDNMENIELADEVEGIKKKPIDKLVEPENINKPQQEIENLEIEESELAEALGEESPAKEIIKTPEVEGEKSLEEKTLGNILNINWEELKKAKAKVTITIDFGG